MANLAEQVKEGLYNEFLSIHEELNEYVLSKIKESGSAYVGVASSYKLIETETESWQRGMKRINERLFDAARTYYQQQGFFFRIDYSPMRTIRKGFFVSIID